MARKKKKSSGMSMKPVMMMIGVGALGVAGFAYYVQSTPGASQIPVELRRQEEISDKPQTRDSRTTRKQAATSTFELKIPELKGEEVTLTGEVSAPPEGIDEQVYVATKSFESMGITGGRALGIELKDDIAYLDVNGAVASHGYGSMEEGQLVKALQLALGQFKDIDRFVLVFEGQQLDTLGHLELVDPIDVIRS